ncbi:MAG TPA: polysaccharide synthesis protein GtrA [Methylophilaceae bacterium]|nr:polysaccharide synthesis protein GtrA [Methylophilaceae bacterium]
MPQPSSSFNHHQKSATWFTVIGAVAACVHYIVAVGLERFVSLQPTWSNVLGFALAFPVSYIGHSKFSFASQNALNRQALPRFLCVALAGFVANQSLVVLGLRYTPLPFWLLLGIVMVVVAVSTYLLSRYWAFKSGHPPL